MFMRRNRAINGAVQPERTVAADAAAQRKSRKLSPNLSLDPGAEDWRFQPNLETCERINDNHYEGGVSGDGTYGVTYEQHIPHVGAPDTMKDRSRRLQDAP